MKKWLVCFLAFAVVFCFAACGQAPEEEAPEETEAEESSASAADDDELYVALVTDVGNIDDQSFNQACWEAVSEFAEEFDLEYAYYRPANQSAEALTAAISSAVDEGVDVMVCPGSLFEPILYDLQFQYPQIIFLMIDGEPHSAEGDTYATAPNVHCIVYQEEQAGYLAGYAAVTEGYTKLGFVGGMEVPAVVRFGYGFIQGADQAAQKANSQVEINYWYSGTFDPSDEIYRTCADWYKGGTQAVFACGGKLFKSVIQAAEEGENRHVIGVDVDQSPISATIVTSAMKELKSTAYDALCVLMDNNWIWPDDYAGATARLGAADDATGLPTDDASWRFEKFTKDDYEALFNGLVDGSVSISDSIYQQPDTVNTTVHFIR